MNNKSIRTTVLERDKYTCQRCKVKFKESELDIHHIRPKTLGGKNDIDNLVTWCKNCHRIYHIKYGADIYRDW